MDLSVLRGMIDRAVGREGVDDAKQDDNKQVVVPNRAEKRRMRRSHYTVTNDRQYNKPRHRTGKPDWFRTMLARIEVRRVLVAVPVTALALPDSVVTGLVAAGYKNVWDLSQAKREDLLKAKGIGPATLKKIRDVLVRRSVPVAWKAE